MAQSEGKRFSQEEIAEITAKEKALKAEVEKQGYTILWTHYYRENIDDLTRQYLNGDWYWEHPRQYAATSCILLVGDEIVSRGFAVCSYEDQPLKTYGRWLSLKRAFYAAENEVETKQLSTKGCANIDATTIQAASTKPALTPVEASRIAKIKPCEACHA